MSHNARVSQPMDDADVSEPGVINFVVQLVRELAG